MISDIGCNRYDVNFIVVDFQTEFEITRINGIHNTYRATFCWWLMSLMMAG